MCGENYIKYLSKHKTGGSPPHVRGKHVICCILISQNGITPACAGKTIAQPSEKPPNWDHPRMCGENYEVLQ